jgi:hypothetical protein
MEINPIRLILPLPESDIAAIIFKVIGVAGRKDIINTTLCTAVKGNITLRSRYCT